MHVSALAFQIFKFAGVAYLLYLAWSMWRETGGLSFDSQGKGRAKSLGKIALRGFLINILNPKLSIFFLAFLPLFVTPEGGEPLPQMLMLSAVFMAMTLGIFILYGLCADLVRAKVTGSPRLVTWMQRSFAAVFAAMGLKLALAEQ